IVRVLLVSVSYSTFDFAVTEASESCALSLHDALPIWASRWRWKSCPGCWMRTTPGRSTITSATRTTAWRRRSRRTSAPSTTSSRSEEHTSELQSRENLVCRLLLETKKQRPSQQDHHLP